MSVNRKSCFHNNPSATLLPRTYCIIANEVALKITRCLGSPVNHYIIEVGRLIASELQYEEEHAQLQQNVCEACRAEATVRLEMNILQIKARLEMTE